MNVVFDFGAVLFTWQPGQLLLQTFPEHVATPQAAAQLAQKLFDHPDWNDFDRGVLPAQEVIARTARRLDLPAAPLGQLVHGIGENLRPMQGTVALLDMLRGRRQTGDGVAGLYYLSNMPMPYARTIQGKHAFLQWFDGGLFSGDVKHIKPEPAIYRMLQEQHGLDPATTVFIDDLKANVDTARSLGWQGIHFESPQQLQAQLALLGF